MSASCFPKWKVSAIWKGLVVVMRDLLWLAFGLGLCAVVLGGATSGTVECRGVDAPTSASVAPVRRLPGLPMRFYAERGLVPWEAYARVRAAGVEP